MPIAWWSHSAEIIPCALEMSAKVASTGRAAKIFRCNLATVDIGTKPTNDASGDNVRFRGQIGHPSSADVTSVSDPNQSFGATLFIRGSAMTRCGRGDACPGALCCCNAGDFHIERAMPAGNEDKIARRRFGRKEAPIDFIYGLKMNWFITVDGALHDVAQR